MRKIIVVPDSFKGTFSSVDVANKIKEKLNTNFPEYEVSTIPIADGGEGTVDAVINIFSSKKVFVRTVNAFFKEIDSYYTIFNNTAVIEVASCLGFKANDKLNPAIASSYGIGLMIKDAIMRGVKNIYIGLGGTITNDAGCGIAAALGAKFYDKGNNLCIPKGISLNDINDIDLNKLPKNITVI